MPAATCGTVQQIADLRVRYMVCLDCTDLPSVFVILLLWIYWKEVLHEVFSKLFVLCY